MISEVNSQKLSISSVSCFIVSSVAFVFAMIIGFNTSSIEPYYWYIFLLPLTFSIVNVFSSRLYKRMLNSPVTMILIIFYFIRFCVSPFLFALGGYVSFYPVSFSKGSFFYAIAIMCFELITVFFVANKYIDRTVGSKTVFFRQGTSSGSTHMFLITFLLLLFVLISYFTVAEIQQVNQFIFNVKWETLSSINYDNETIVARGSIGRYIFSLWSFLWPILRIIIAPLFISFFYNKISRKSISIVLSTGSLVLPCLFIGTDNIAPFIGIALGAITIRHLYGKKANFIIAICLVVATVLIGIVVSSKMIEFQLWRGASGTSLVAQLLNAYFPGIENGALTLDLPKNNYFEHLFFDFYYAVPFKETLFGFSGTRLNDLFNSFVNVKGTIVPFVFQISYYFTGLGGCFVVGVFIRLAYKLEKKAKESNAFWYYYISTYASFLIITSISIYSFSIFFRNVLCIYVPLRVIVFISKKRNSRRSVG